MSDAPPMSGPESPLRDLPCAEAPVLKGCGAEPGEKCNHPSFDENPEVHHLARIEVAHETDTTHEWCSLLSSFGIDCQEEGATT